MGTRCVPKNSLNIIAKPTALCNNEIPPVCGDVAVSSSNPVSSSSHGTCEGREREAYAGRWARAQGPAKREDALGRNARARKTRRAQDARARRARGGGAGRASPQDALGRTRKSAQGAGRGTRDARRAGRWARDTRVCRTLIKRANDRTAYVFSMGSARRARTPHAPWAIIPP